jgi:error-prone DNA polymerase
MSEPYAELHCHSCFSFLDGVSSPEELVEEATKLGLSGLALTDHNGLYGAVRFARAAREHGLPSVFGAELTISEASQRDLEDTPMRNGTLASHPRTGVPDPPGQHLVVLARDEQGYALLSRAISTGNLRAGEKGRIACSLQDLARQGAQGAQGAHHWLVLTGCRKGIVASALMQEGPSAARAALWRLVDLFGKENVAVEIWDHGDPIDTVRNQVLAEISAHVGVSLVAVNNVHYATRSKRRLADAVAAIRARRTLEEMDPWLPPAAMACLRSAEEQSRRFARWPGAVARAAELAEECAFDLALVAPGLPPFPVPPGYDEQSWLEQLVSERAVQRYGERTSERVPGAWAQIDHELEVIGKLGFAGYFLVVWDIVEMCKARDIYCQGRGSAANSAVCYALGITRADAVSLGLLFERFLSPARDGPPDIDVDIESSRREEVIAYVYERYGREHAAQVGSFITYRSRSALRDLSGVLRGCPGEAESKLSSELAREALDMPKHLGLHTGGMVICDRPIIEVCPVEWARKEGRTVLQWDKDDCASIGLVKFDLLGLGMLEALHHAVDHVYHGYGEEVDLSLIDQEDEVYQMLCAADTVGVFQVESRAQMATLPRMQPRCFADLVVEVALIRPGPIQGGSVHPYLRRRKGLEASDPPHPLLGPALQKTLGVPLFQEQLMRIAIDAAGFTAAEADELRQAMGAKRSGEAMSRLADRLFKGMAERGIPDDVAHEIYNRLAAFASFGFPESHAISFAYLVYASAWLKLHYPSAFYAGLLDAQPMGFWSPQSLVNDAKRHAVEVRPPHVNTSLAHCTLEPLAPRTSRGGLHHPALRLGLGMVRNLAPSIAAAVAKSRLEDGPFSSMEDLAQRCCLSAAQMEALALAGALEGLPPDSSWAARLLDEADVKGPLSRRRALWGVGPLCLASGSSAGAKGQLRLPGVLPGTVAPELPQPSPGELAGEEIWSMGLTLGPSVVGMVRERLDVMGVVCSSELWHMKNGSPVSVAGVVTHRQRPYSAKGMVFMSLEDEAGLVNAVFVPGIWAKWSQVGETSPAVIVHGRLEKADGVINVLGLRLEPLSLPCRFLPAARDFR